MHEELRNWKTVNVSEMEAQFAYCKKALLLFDQIEQHRNLAQHEFLLQNKIRERIYMLANFIETKWKQGFTCNWLKSGDKNTKFFHAFASARSTKNIITQIIHEDAQITNEETIRSLLKQHMEGLLGSSNQVLDSTR